MTNALTPIVIRQTTAADREVVINLLLAQFREHDISLSAAALTAAIDGVLEHPERGSVFVATVEGTPIGVAYLSFTWALEHGGKTAWLEEL